MPEKAPARRPPVDNEPWNTLANFLNAERYQESGGNYQAVNPTSGALGAFQVMPGNLPGWLAQSGLPPMTPYAFLHDPSAQNQLATTILGGYYNTYGPYGAAAMWYSGQPDSTATYGDPPVWQYCDDVVALMQQKLPGPNYGPAPGGPDFNLPPPNPADASPTIKAAGATQVYAGNVLAAAAAYISSLR